MIRLEAQGPTRRLHRRQPPIKRRAAVLFGGYVAVTVLILGLFLWHLHGNARDAGLKLVNAFAVVAEEQSVATILSVEQALDFAELYVLARKDTITSIGIREFIRQRAYLSRVLILDQSGVILESDVGLAPGTSVAHEAYVRHHRDNPSSALHIGGLARMADGTWAIPVSRAIREHGELRGIVVAAIDARLFDRAWHSDREPGQVLSLARIDGEILTRTPFEEHARSGQYLDSGTIARLAAGAMHGQTRVRHSDGAEHLMFFRRLDHYPNLVVTIALPWARIFEEWRSVVRIVAIGWVFGAAAVAALTIWIVRESIARANTQRRFRLLFDASPYPMLVVHRESRRLLAVNDAAVEQYGWSRHEMLGMNIRQLLAAPEGDDDFMARGLAAAGEVISASHRKKNDESLVVDITARPIEFGGEPAVLAIAHDVSRRATAERERAAAEEQLRQSQKMESVGQLTGGIAHDFNNILMVIFANVEALLEERGLGDTIMKRVNRIADAMQRASDLTQQLLAFSRKQSLKPEVTDINELVVRTSKMLRRSLGEHVEMQVRLSPDIFPVKVDRTQLETALLNLCINARDAMKGGGKLLIETSNTELGDVEARAHGALLPGEYALISVTDTGTGIPMDLIDKVFEPFFTTKEVGKGTGLGLSMVYGFIKQSSGHISVYSELNRGTTFKLYLPRTEPTDRPSVDQQIPPVVVGRERILVVEDEAPVRETVVEQLRGLGYSVEQAADGTEALAKADAEQRPFDLLLTDVVMPGAYNGKALADEILNRFPQTRVVYMSGYTQDVIAQHGGMGDGTLLLGKPFRHRDLAEIIRRALD